MPGRSDPDRHAVGAARMQRRRHGRGRDRRHRHAAQCRCVMSPEPIPGASHARPAASSSAAASATFFSDRAGGVDIAASTAAAASHQPARHSAGHGRSYQRVCVVTANHSTNFAEVVGSDVTADLARRDFTVNAMAVPLAGADELLDRTPAAQIGPPDHSDGRRVQLRRRSAGCLKHVRMA